jgi:arylsulfatase A-like enzyme
MPLLQTGRPARPNIVFILADDLGYGDIGALNGGRTTTPRLDALLRESLCLSHHYAASPVCNPSRAALLTGRYPHRTGSIDTLEWRGLERLALAENTLADVLQAAGYVTGLVGKWHLGAFSPAYHPTRRGFQETVCFRGGMHDYFNWRVEYGPTRVETTDGRYLTDLWTQEAVNFITRHQQEPFFLHLNYNAPHTPLQAPAEDLAVFAEREELTPAVRTLYAMIRRLDRGVGEVLDTLKRCGLERDTIVVFCSDNGPQFGGLAGNCLDRYNCQLHGAKGSVHEGGIRVPALVRWPAGLPTGTHAGFFHMVDWRPTLLQWAGVPDPGERPLDGVDQSGVLRQERPPYQPTRCWQWNRYEPNHAYNAAIRDGPWKLIRPFVPEAFMVPDLHWLEVSMYRPEHFLEHGLVSEPAPSVPLPPPPPVELYEVERDPLESENLAQKHPEMVYRLEHKLDLWFEDVMRDCHRARQQIAAAP